jgi:hypothetical protein
MTLTAGLFNMYTSLQLKCDETSKIWELITNI